MGRNWFVRRGGKQKGPFSAEFLKKYADAGKLRPDDDVRMDGQPDWVKASVVRGLFVAGPHDASLVAVDSVPSTIEQQGDKSGSEPRHMLVAGDDNNRGVDAGSPASPSGILELIRKSARLVFIALTATGVLVSAIVATVYLGGVGSADGRSRASRQKRPGSVIVEEQTSVWPLLPTGFPGSHLGMPEISIEGPRASWVEFSDFKRDAPYRIIAVVKLIPPPHDGTFLPSPTYFRYEHFDKSGVKLGRNPLGIPKIGVGEKARVEFYIDEDTKKIVINVGA